MKAILLLLLFISFRGQAQLPSMVGFMHTRQQTGLPDPPALLSNDITNTITATSANPVLYSKDGGTTWWNYVEPLFVGDLNRPAGFIRFKVKTASGTESTIVPSGNFSASGASYAQPKKIVVLGSSTSAGSGANPSYLSYVNKLREYFRELNAGDTIYNLASGGYSTYQILPTWDAKTFYYGRSNGYPIDTNKNITAALKLNPDAIIVNLPSNDATGLHSNSESINNLNWVIATADSMNVPVYVSTAQPRNSASAAPTNIPPNLLSTYKDSILNNYGNKVLDFWSSLHFSNTTSINPYYDADGIHLLNQGHDLLFNRVMKSDLFAGLWQPVSHVNTRPIAFRVRYTGSLQVGQTLTGTYRYWDVDDDMEAGTQIQWYRSGHESNVGNASPIPGANSLTYVLTPSDVNQYIFLQVTPKNANGTGQWIRSFNFYGNTVVQ